MAITWGFRWVQPFKTKVFFLTTGSLVLSCTDLQSNFTLYGSNIFPPLSNYLFLDDLIVGGIVSASLYRLTPISQLKWASLASQTLCSPWIPCLCRLSSQHLFGKFGSRLLFHCSLLVEFSSLTACFSLTDIFNESGHHSICSLVYIDIHLKKKQF